MTTAAKNRLDMLLGTRPQRRKFSTSLPADTLERLEAVRAELQGQSGVRPRVADVAAHALEIGLDALLQELRNRNA